METGIVKWFNNAKGFGFICSADGGEDIFAHYSCIQMEGYRTLKAGQKVQFSVTIGPKGNHADVIIPMVAEENAENAENVENVENVENKPEAN